MILGENAPIYLCRIVSPDRDNTLHLLESAGSTTSASESLPKYFKCWKTSVDKGKILRIKTYYITARKFDHFQAVIDALRAASTLKWSSFSKRKLLSPAHQKR